MEQSANARYAKKVGSLVGGKWQLDRLLGCGSTSAVYAASRASDHDERVAIKILHSHLCRDETIVRRFLREAYVANAIVHRSLVHVHEDGVTDNSVYLVLDLLDGETLEERRVRQGGKLAFDTIAHHILDLMSALMAVHATGIVHRDLKPQNVFITQAGSLKLLDFGTARVFDAEGNTPISIDGLVIGTPSFMSPEQARGDRANIDAQSDIWSLGATLFTTLSGEYVHLGRGSHQRLLAAATKEPRSFAAVAPFFDARITAVIDRALAFEKRERWPNMRAMRAAFRSAMIGLDAISEPPPPSSSPIV